MALTLADVSASLADKVAQEVIDEFRRNSYLLDNLIFDDAVSPGTGGSTLTYGYTQLSTPSTAAFREINSEYESNEAKKVKKSCELKIFGGSASIDRVLQKASGKILKSTTYKRDADFNYYSIFASYVVQLSICYSQIRRVRRELKIHRIIDYFFELKLGYLIKKTNPNLPLIGVRFGLFSFGAGNRT